MDDEAVEYIEKRRMEEGKKTEGEGREKQEGGGEGMSMGRRKENWMKGQRRGTEWKKAAIFC